MTHRPHLPILLILLLVTGCGSSDSPPSGGLPAASDRGPGMRPLELNALSLSVPRTTSLEYVEAPLFAAALGNDPARIFEFVRDSVGYQAYTGVLRGPRGTLLAMAGNAADRASLLAAMLEGAGRRVRFARGRLAERDARILVTSMWVERREPVAGQEPPAELTSVAQAFVAAVRRDVGLIRSHLTAIGHTPQRSAAHSLDALTAEARDHFWVQMARGTEWVDLDPSFRDSTMGRAHAQADETIERLPETMFHRVRIRIRVEESAAGTSSSREIFSHDARAADLSGHAVLLSHFPENWKGPAGSVAEGISAAIEDTGRVKPVLILGDQAIAGEAFFARPPGAGIGSIRSLLGGQGTREPIPLAAAEFLEVEFTAPGGATEKVVRDLFDFVGPARRAAGQGLSPEELAAGVAQPDAFDVTKAVFSLFFTTGSVDRAHVRTIEAPASPASGGEMDIGAVLHELNVAFAAGSDMLAERTGRPDRAVVLFYQDSPRLTIADLSESASAVRLTLDLRRDHARAVAMGPRPELSVLARMQRGVVDGTLERVLLELFLPDSPPGGDAVRASVSTSALFETAAARNVRTVVLRRPEDRLGDDVPPDAQARIREDLSRGRIVVAPERAVAVRGAPRYGWWRINPTSGETTAVTDEGLHAAASEFTAVTGKSEKGTAKVNIYYNGTFKRVLVETYDANQIRQLGGLPRLLQMLRREGIGVIHSGSLI